MQCNYINTTPTTMVMMIALSTSTPHQWLQNLSKFSPEILLSLLSLLLLLYLPNKHKKFIPTNFPIIGMLPTIVLHFHHLHDRISEVLKESGGTFLFRGPWLAGMTILVTSDPANVHHVLTNNFPNYTKGEEFREMFDVLGDGIFNADGESWRAQRRLAHAFVAGKGFREFAAQATKAKAEEVVVLLEQLDGRTLDVQDDLFMRVSFDVICYLVFGVDPGSLSVDFPEVPFAKALDDVWEALVLRYACPKTVYKAMNWLRLGTEGRMVRAQVVIDEFIAQQIERKRNQPHLNKDRADLLSLYYDVATSSEMAEKIDPDTFMRDTLLTLMIAGRDGFAICLSWLLWLLSNNRHVELKILEELKLHRSRDNTSSVFDSDELNKMVYLHGAVCETLRLFPPVPYEHKAATGSDVLPSGHKVQPGTKVLISNFAMGRSEEIWGKDWEEMRPERWVDSESGRIVRVPSYKFTAFNSGPRVCIGRDIALMQIKTIAAAVIWNFEVDVVDGAMVAPKNSVLLRMKDGMKVKIRRRTSFP